MCGERSFKQHMAFMCLSLWLVGWEWLFFGEGGVMANSKKNTSKEELKVGLRDLRLHGDKKVR